MSQPQWNHCSRRIIKPSLHDLRTHNAEEYSGLPIPIDLIIEILSRLPLKSVVICRSVSKLWASILGSPDFTETFLARSSPPPQLLFACGNDDGKLFFFSSPQPQNLDEKESTVAASYHMNMNLPDTTSYFTAKHIGGFVNFGKFSFVNGSKDVPPWMICNPRTGQSFTLPERKTQKGYTCMTFSGYDPIEKQIKVLSITWETEGDNAISNEHHILTLETDKMSWRMIECGTPHYPIYDSICIDGVLYYKAFSSDFKFMIVCFDVRSEKFNSIRIRESSMRAMHYATTLVNYNGKLASLKLDSNVASRSNFEMWLLEDPEKQEWSKHIWPTMWNCVIKGDIVGVTGTNEIVSSPALILSDPFYVYYYSLESQTTRSVGIRGMSEFKGKRVYTLVF